MKIRFYNIEWDLDYSDEVAEILQIDQEVFPEEIILDIAESDFDPKYPLDFVDYKSFSAKNCNFEILSN